MKITINKKIFILFSILSIFMALTIFLLNQNIVTKKANIDKLPIHHIMGSFSINVDDFRELARDADNIFIARIDELIDTEYRDMFKKESEQGDKDWWSPYTNYKVTVLDNIKGDLVRNISIPIRKAGGVIYDKSAVEIYEDDELL